MYRVPAMHRGSGNPRHQPVTSLAKPYPAGWRVPRHWHRRGQLMYAESGVAEISAREGLWILPTQRALWIPPGLTHEVRMQTEVAARTLYLDRALSATIGTECRVFFVSKLLRELILAVVGCQAAKRERTRVQLMTPLLVHELLRSDSTAIHLPWPSDARLLRACRYILQDPSRSESMDVIARAAGASARTLTRLADAELHMPFARWRQQVRLARALNHIVMGDSIKSAAHDAGYKSCSAFSAMFHRALGASPTMYAGRQPSRSSSRSPRRHT
jgi:AraC-like DNA-binding protein